MDIVVGIVIGLVIYAIFEMRRRSAAAAPPEPATPTAAPVDPVARLHGLNSALGAVGDASSHPRDLASNETFREAVGVLASRDVALNVVTDFAAGLNWMLAAAGFAALAERDDRDSASPLVARHFRHVSPWPLYYALQLATRLKDRPAIGALVLNGPEFWAEHALVPSMFAEHFAARTEAGDPPTFGDTLNDATPAAINNAEALLRKINHPAASSLLEELSAWRRKTLDRTYLQTFGRFVDPDTECELLVEHAGIKEHLAAAESFLLHEPFRSALVIAEPRGGKTSFVMLLAARAAAEGWTVFEAGAANLMAGQQYFGQLEERLHRLTTELSVDKRVIWYAPDFLQLASSGMHIGQTASVLDQLLPAIAAGRIVMISETTAAGLTSSLQRRPALRSAVELVRLRPATEREGDALAHELASRVAKFAKLQIPAEITEVALYLARHYLGADQMPGAALDLIKLTAQRLMANGAKEMRREDLLTTLSQLSGMPTLVLDDRERVELASIRKYFSARVIGQDEAVDVVVDRIAMLKAGLTDPGRPIAVFLFAGPTGTGKTELAKTLAGFLFGSADRLIRLDMSEFQAVESTRKILGEVDQQADSQALTQRVRKQPFSVVLLDEFEKAHANIWDLFLQVFDDGRLTDASGHTVDFRHCIIILTSNLGSKIQDHANPGFVSTLGAFSQEHVLRAVNQSFRPEFVNRLDAIIVFRPLTRELMRGILAKELDRVLERRGLRYREWAVEWESSALDFLLDKGFSQAMGARPLKRAIDRFLLAPLAATLVEHRFPQGDQFLFVRSDGRAIQVEFVDPDAPSPPAAPLESEPAIAPGLSLARLMLQPTGAAEERAALLAELKRIDAAVNDTTWAAVEESLAAEMQQADFWQRQERFDVLARYALVDRVKAAIGTARGLEARLSRSAERSGWFSRDLVLRLASQLYIIRHGIDDVLAGAQVEVVLSVQPVLDAAPDPAATARWCERLLEMYRRWGTRRHMQWEDLPPRPGSPALAVVSGFGVARVLAAEAGLHTLEYEGARDEIARAVARVRVAPTPAVLSESIGARTSAFVAALNAAPAPSAVVRRYRLDSSPLIRDVANGWRTGRQELVLEGDFDLLPEVLGRATAAGA